MKYLLAAFAASVLALAAMFILSSNLNFEFGRLSYGLTALRDRQLIDAHIIGVVGSILGLLTVTKFPRSSTAVICVFWMPVTLNLYAILVSGFSESSLNSSMVELAIYNVLLAMILANVIFSTSLVRCYKGIKARLVSPAVEPAQP